ncbi:peroxisomal acyl-coenzyme A oxidase 3 [Schistocerca gregaria]|uniref:peroxisomal acyl-coenzyme A oxidase 3 n=1 Tax=Schistocerca gregaria TaxID=7010 RepID=UPI00211EE152|nr:peroxisomal acyl-coenzyme A oxidase 3 [Schistocerca gregaria]XP_049858044.1 peroxisomal acyl-coenzyme A oxidase 3 [Schistocerca gregaria]XP_049858045.1 peroxisomal acyl-coenzyme A oxidase 3 [Schistocerca gregaria]XP_049858046.1 peroxisomal acyl-coenzyme A oxidase 3 [Schistocerca gregaria]XP_049858047.1 peroxisomal acyl-coenzyme A oxidase 3 [Schistocerca gregaria]
MAHANDTSFIPDLPSGPLDDYRRKASFDWKKMKLVFEKPDVLKLKMKVWETLKSDVLFQHLTTTPSAEEQKHRAALQLSKLHQYRFYTDEILSANYRNKTRSIMTINEATAALSTDLSVKFAAGVALCSNTILTLGTERHLHFFKAVWNGEILSCLALTEVEHGSNTKKMRTTATYDPSTQEFIIHTPDFRAAKCWAGNLGKTCTHAVLFAQLVTADGVCHGLHAFMVPIRNPKTLMPYTGIIVGDMGEKIGLNGIDNGFIIFQNYRIPRENLLNRVSDVTPEGEYETFFTNPQQLLGASLENLSAGRVGIMQESANTLCHSVCIAVRYSAIRKQFGPDENEELPILEYQLQQWRLLPYVSAACALKVFVSSFTDQYLDCVEESNSGGKLRRLNAMVSEIHAMVSASKPLITWTCAYALQECREACGGNGYLKASGLGELRNNHDAKVTYEGDNNVLLQQTSNWLLRQWRQVQENSSSPEVASPLKSAYFLLHAKDILSKQFTGSCLDDVLRHTFVKESFQWLICWLLNVTEHRYQTYLKNCENNFTARNNVQVYFARTLSVVYAQNNVLVYFWQKCNDLNVEEQLKPALIRMYLLYGLWCLEKHLVILYEGGYAQGPKVATLVKEAILHLCHQLKDDAVAIVDALAPPDYILNSVLGKSDGKVYDNLQTTFFHSNGAMGRPYWWNEVVPKQISKL